MLRTDDLLQAAADERPQRLGSQSNDSSAARSRTAGL